MDGIFLRQKKIVLKIQIPTIVCNNENNAIDFDFVLVIFEKLLSIVFFENHIL